MFTFGHYHFSEAIINEKFDEHTIANAGICQNCFIKINEIDEHQMITERIQKELLVLYSQSGSISEDITCEEERVYEVKQENDGSAEAYRLVEVCNDEEPYESEHFLEEESESQSPTQIKRHYKRRKDLDAGLTVVSVEGVKAYQCDICLVSIFKFIVLGHEVSEKMILYFRKYVEIDINSKHIGRFIQQRDRYAAMSVVLCSKHYPVYTLTRKFIEKESTINGKKI